MAIRDALKPLLEGKFETEYVPDELDIRQSIAWVNERAEPDSVAVDVHLNASRDLNLRGTEAYYWQLPNLAMVFARHVSEALDVPNRGAKPDTQTYVGELGWLRQLKCRSVVVECLYMTNIFDRARLLDHGPEKSAQGLYNALREVVPRPDDPEAVQKELTALQVAMVKLWELLRLLKAKWMK